MEKKSRYKKLGRIFLFIILNLLFSVTVLWVAYNNRVKIKRWLDHENDFSKEDKVIMYDIFSSKLIDEQEDLILPPVNNSDELIDHVNRSTLPDSLDLSKIYDSCKVLSAQQFRPGVLKIKYLLFKDTLESYTYVRNNGVKPTRVVLYISGTGDNRARKVATRTMDGEDPMLQAQQIKADIYFPVFPADDLRAIHDGVKMLDIKKVISYAVSNGRSFALRYFADIFSIEKYLRTRYTSLQTWGHSRGGYVALVAGSFFLPDTLIISSGYSVKSYKFFRLGPDQAYWSNSSIYWDKNRIKETLGNKKTAVYFLFGKKEKETYYGLETKHFYTEKFFKDCPNIKVRYSNNDHVWFSDEISQILSGK